MYTNKVLLSCQGALDFNNPKTYRSIGKLISSSCKVDRFAQWKDWLPLIIAGKSKGFSEILKRTGSVKRTL